MKLIRGARTFSHRLIQLLCGLPEGNHRIRLTNEFKLDLCWWSRWAATFNGEACLIEKNWGQGPVIATDSTLTGLGAVHELDWIAGTFNCTEVPLDYNCLNCIHGHWQTVHIPDYSKGNINLFEFIPIYLAICRWGYLWCNKQVLCLSDNTQTVHMVNVGKSSNLLCMHYIREIF